MIKNYKLFTESLLNKMTGYSEEEIKNNFINGEIDYRKYLSMCEENGWEKPTYEVLYKLFKEGKLNPLLFYSECVNNNWKIPTNEEIFDALKVSKPSDMLYYSLKLKNYDGIKQALEIGAEPTGHDFEFLVRKEFYNGTNDIVEEDLEIVNLLLSKGVLPYSNVMEELIRNCYPENKLTLKLIETFLQKYSESENLKKSLNVDDLLYWCESNNNEELLNMIIKYLGVTDYKKPKKKWYERFK